MARSYASRGPPVWESVEVAAAHVQAAEQRGEVVQAPGNEVPHAAFGFQLALHHQQPRLQERAALALGKLAPDHDVDHAVLVLEGDEGDAAGGLRTLAADDQAGRNDAAARCNPGQLL